MSDQSLRNAPIEDRFISRIEVRPESDCWYWTGFLNAQGYGHITLKGRLIPVHRFSYELFVGAIPAGLVLDHLCRNRACANPWHLEPVTNRENILRGEAQAATNARKTHCLRGHPLSGSNLIVRRNGHRTCRVCRRASQRAWEQRQRYGLEVAA